VFDYAADAPGSGIADVTTWVNFGVLGLVVLSLLTGWLWTKPSVDKLQAEKDRAVKDRQHADAQRDAMATVLQDKLLPVVGDFIATTRALMPVLQQLQQLQAMIPILQELIRLNDVGDKRGTRPPPRGSKHKT
jgi:hypothetical protein